VLHRQQYRGAGTPEQCRQWCLGRARLGRGVGRSQWVQQHGRQVGVGEGDRLLPAEVRGDQPQAAASQVQVTIDTAHVLDFEDGCPPAHDGPQSPEETFRSAVQQVPPSACALGVDAGLHAVAVGRDGGVVVPAQR
jgi:hypothetical protein